MRRTKTGKRTDQRISKITKLAIKTKKGYVEIPDSDFEIGEKFHFKHYSVDIPIYLNSDEARLARARKVN